MSSTNRGAERQPNDFYRTPEWTTRAIVRELVPSSTVLDPCAGDGAILGVVRELWPGCSTIGIELDPVRAEIAGATCADALSVEWPSADAIIMNPPFGLAMEFVQAGVSEMRTGRVRTCVVALLRLAFLESQKRSEWLRMNMPSVFVLPTRPSFIQPGSGGKRQTDSAAYAWFVWYADQYMVPTIHVLDVADLLEKKSKKTSEVQA